MLEALHTNPTQIAGLIAFGVAALACLRAARGRPSPWGGLMLAQWACCAEIAFGLRFRVHDAVDAVLQAHDVYELRTPVQIALLALVLAAATVGFCAAQRGRRRDPDGARAGIATIGAVTLFVVESVSLHGVDALMYLPVGPILAVSLGWIAAAALVTASALRAAHH